MYPLYCTIIEVSYTGNVVYTPENSKSAHRVVVLDIQRRKTRAFQMCIHFDCTIIGV